MSFLLLSNWTEQSVNDTEKGRITVHATCTIAPVACVHCACVANLYRWAVKEQEFVDSPARGCSVRILVSRQRYKCRECSATFFQPLPDMDEEHRMTRRCVAYIEEQAVPLTFSFVAKNVGVDPKTIRNIFDAFTERQKQKGTVIAPRLLGIDEKTILHKARCVLTDIEQRKPLDILTNHSQATLARWLTLLKEKERVEVVNIDMWRPYKNAAQAVLPKAAIVIDHFHVVKPANKCMDDVRKIVGKTGDDKRRVSFKRSAYLLKKRKSNLKDSQLLDLEAWLATEPVLKQAYELKESFFDIYTAPTRQEAEQMYAEWRKSMPPQMAHYFDSLITSMTNWHEEIFNFFDHKTTNAYTEALNNIINNRIGNGRGYSFEVIRAKILYDEYKPVKPKPDVVKEEKEQMPVTIEPPIPIEPEEEVRKVFLPEHKNSPETILWYIYTESGGVCPSCKGKYRLDFMRLYEGRVLPGKVWVVCAKCYDRFNTEPETFERTVSTHYSR